MPSEAGAAVGVMGGLGRGTGQGAAALYPAGLRLTSFFFSFFFLIFYITKLEAWQAARRSGFDSDEGRNVEYEPEMTSQTWSPKIKLWREEKNNNLKTLTSLFFGGGRVWSDPSRYTRTASIHTDSVTSRPSLWPTPTKNRKEHVLWNPAVIHTEWGDARVWLCPSWSLIEWVWKGKSWDFRKSVY